MTAGINRQTGWKPHVVCEFVDITKETLRYWRNTVHPKEACKSYSSYDILIYLVIKELVEDHGVQLARLKEIDWNDILQEFSNVSFLGLDKKTINFDLKNIRFDLYDSLDEFDYLKGYNHFLDLGKHSKQVLNKLMNYGMN